MQKLVSLAFIFLCLMVSCKKSDNSGIVELPQEVLGTFTGNLTYQINGDADSQIDNLAGTVTVTKNGKAVKFSFSDGLPAIDNLKFRGNSGGFVSVVDEGGVAAGISITKNALNFGIDVGGKQYAFQGIK
jgi:hypothetical protein